MSDAGGRPGPLKLGVNIDHVATLREARYRGRAWGEPDPVEAALLCEAAGAAGITAHLREDRRHIQDRDVYALRARIRTRLNLEMALAPEIVEIAVRVRPDIVCLVPERREEVTTEGGLDVAGQLEWVAAVRRQMNAVGAEVSAFIGPDLTQVDAAAAAGVQFIELHTGAYAERFLESRQGKQLMGQEAGDVPPAGTLGAAGSGEALSWSHGIEEELDRLVAASERAKALGLRVNAGHGMTVVNLPALLERVPHLEELNIGHSLVSRAVTVGMAAAVGEFLEVMRGYRVGSA